LKAGNSEKGMTITEAITILRSVGEVRVERGSIRARIPHQRTPELRTAVEVLRDRKAEALVILKEERKTVANQVGADGLSEPLEAVLKGHAVELWCDVLRERLWIVADEEDAATLGEPRGSLYTAPEVRKIISIRDRDIAAAIHAWKKQFGGKLA
jgi:hypothetical protein